MKKSMGEVLSREKVKKYIDTTSQALKKVDMVAPEKSFGNRIARDILDMARAYYSDAKHFYSKGEYVNAFACINYAHGWLDAGARLGLFDVGGDDKLFTLAE